MLKRRTMLIGFAALVNCSLLATVFSPQHAIYACTTLSECSREVDNAKQAREALQAEVNKIKGETKTIEEQIYNLQLQVSTFVTQIDAAAKTIASLETQRVKLQESMDKTEAILRDRLVQMQLYYETDKNLNFIANSSSITEMIERTQTVEELTNADKELIQQYDHQKKEVEKNKVETEKTKADLEKYKAEKEDMIVKNAALIKEYEKREAELDAKIGDTVKTQELSQAEIEKIKEAAARIPITSPIPVVGENTAGYPIAHAIKTADYLGLDEVHRVPHGGTDYAPLGDRTLFSLVDGIVVKSEFMPGGYGWYIIIAFQDSGGWKTVLYGHMASQTPLSVGTSVTRGQAIGVTGTTGNSTGIHLHLEVAVAGPGPSFVFQKTGSPNKLDAATYFKLPASW